LADFSAAGFLVTASSSGGVALKSEEIMQMQYEDPKKTE
jgi:hypothetical protein